MGMSPSYGMPQAAGGKGGPIDNPTYPSMTAEIPADLGPGMTPSMDAGGIMMRQMNQTYQGYDPLAEGMVSMPHQPSGLEMMMGMPQRLPELKTPYHTQMDKIKFPKDYLGG